jgi:hypothetical protein
VKRFFILFAIFGLALSMQLIAAESIGPPGVAEVRVDSFVLSPVAEQVIAKEFNVTGLDAVALSTSTAIDVAPGFPWPVINSPALAVVSPRVEPMLAGLMYGARLNAVRNNAAEAYLIPIVSDRHGPALSA